MVGRIGKIIGRAAEFNMKNPNTFVRYTQGVTTPFYYAYQSLAYYRSKNIEEDKRKFIVAQTLAEGAMTTAMVLTIPEKLAKVGEKLVEKGIALPSGAPANLRNPEVENTLKGVKNILKGQTRNRKEISKVLKGVANIVKGKVADSAEIIKVLNGKAGNPALTQKMVNFKSGLSMATTILGIFLTFGVITPIVRNFMAKYLQNYIKSGKPENNPQQAKSVKPKALK